MKKISEDMRREVRGAEERHGGLGYRVALNVGPSPQVPSYWGVEGRWEMPIGKLMKISNPGRDWMDKRSIGQSEVQVDWGRAERTRCPLDVFQVAPGPGIEISAINTGPIRGGLEGRQTGRSEKGKKLEIEC